MRPRRRSHAACPPRLASWASLAYLALLATGAHGGEAVRYRDGQGIEMIGGRTTAIPDAVSVPPALAARQAAPLRLQITAHEQQARDRDRLAILRQELDAELAALQENVAHSRSLADEPLQRSREQLRRHQQNIRDLRAEISRTSKAAE